MKTIKTLLLVGMTPFLLTTLNSCTDYQDEIDALDVRVTYLEDLVKKINNNLESLRALVDVVEEGDYIKNVKETDAGYTITFAKHDAITILNGANASMPQITVEKDDDGNTYWKVDGKWPKDEGGNDIKIKANGNDGVTPRVEIKDGYWWVYPTGDTSSGYNTGISVTGTNGKDTNPITDVKVSTQDGTVTFIIYNGLGQFTVKYENNSNSAS